MYLVIIQPLVLIINISIYLRNTVVFFWSSQTKENRSNFSLLPIFAGRYCYGGYYPPQQYLPANIGRKGEIYVREWWGNTILLQLNTYTFADSFVTNLIPQPLTKHAITVKWQPQTTVHNGVLGKTSIVKLLYYMYYGDHIGSYKFSYDHLWWRVRRFRLCSTESAGFGADNTRTPLRCAKTNLSTENFNILSENRSDRGPN